VKKSKQKLFIVRKYIMASSVLQAVKKDKTHPVEECWLDEDYKKKAVESLTPSIGFLTDNDEPIYEQTRR